MNSGTLPVEGHVQTILRQIEAGLLVCPVTKRRLRRNGESLQAEGGGPAYRFLSGRIPVLVADETGLAAYARESERMNAEYTPEHIRKERNWFRRVRRHDYRTEESVRARNTIFEGLGEDAVCIAIGGGPSRVHPALLNLNIGPFPNVDIVADAHGLPYADGSVDAVYCEAVFEHLHAPEEAAREICRVLKKGGKAYVCTPFLQAYHGYPFHYQNFTLTGHRHLFEHAGLSIVESGACVGPTYALRNLTAVFIANYAPFPLRGILRVLWAGLSMAIAPLDILLRRHRNAHVMASTTYLLAEKP